MVNFCAGFICLCMVAVPCLIIGFIVLMLALLLPKQ